jgi:hypothetical protein
VGCGGEREICPIEKTVVDGAGRPVLQLSMYEQSRVGWTGPWSAPWYIRSSMKVHERLQRYGWRYSMRGVETAR